jgi:hypothetical protein
MKWTSNHRTGGAFRPQLWRAVAFVCRMFVMFLYNRTPAELPARSFAHFLPGSAQFRLTFEPFGLKALKQLDLVLLIAASDQHIKLVGE